MRIHLNAMALNANCSTSAYTTIWYGHYLARRSAAPLASANRCYMLLFGPVLRRFLPRMLRTVRLKCLTSRPNITNG